MDKNSKSLQVKKKNHKRSKCFITHIDSKESKPSTSELKINHNNEIIINDEHSLSGNFKISQANELELKNEILKFKSLKNKDACSLNKNSEPKKNEIHFEISKHDSLPKSIYKSYNDKFVKKSHRLSQDFAEKNQIEITIKQAQNLEIDSKIHMNSNGIINSNSKTNFYVDIPQFSNFVLKRNLFKLNSPNNSFSEENININNINYYGLKRKEVIESEKSIIKNNLKFKIELINNEIHNDAKQKKEKKFTKITRASNLLLKTYNELKDSKLLGKKRLIDNNEKTTEKIESSNLIKILFSYDPEINTFKNYIEKPKNTCFQKINFFYERLNFLKKKSDNLREILNSDSKKVTDSLNNYDNPFDNSLRNEYAQTLSFQKKFQEEYIPIQLQKENENASVSKTHFIKKKQTPLNIKRHCGVSYVISSESKQLNVSERYNRLGHLVYQGTYSTQQITDREFTDYINILIENLLFFNPILVTCFESPDQDEMKDYLIFPKKRLEIAKNIYDLWKYAKDKYFLAINLIYDKNLGIRNFTKEEFVTLNQENLLSISDIHIGILFRKATSGIKSVLKLYNSAGMNMSTKFESTHKIMNLDISLGYDKLVENLSGSNITTLSMRIELYVNDQSWKNSNSFSQEFLYTFICVFEEKISKMILFWNENRFFFNENIKKQLKNIKFTEEKQFYTLNNSNIMKSEIQCENKGFTMIRSDIIKHLNELNDNKICNSFLYNFNDILKKDELDYHKFYNLNTNLKYYIENNLISKNNSLNEKFEMKISKSNSNCLPMYIISTRDCFVFDLNVKREIITHENRKIIRNEFFFDKNNIPSNYRKFKTSPNDLKVGIITYENFFSHEELCEIEKHIEKTEFSSMNEFYLPETAQKTSSGEKIKRTKFFFGARYMWTKKQLAEPNSYVAAGIRKDVSPPPNWMKIKVETPLVDAGIILKDFINSYALNIYHDGTEGLGQHFDDAVRFKQPIYTIRTFSDCRLSFGSQLYGFCNGAFTIPLPRGCICIMEENSYSSNGVKHCIRPCDMTGKSSALILRQMHPNMVKEADKYDNLVDFPCWFSTLSLKERIMSYAQQKSLESEMLIKVNDLEKGTQKTQNFDENIFDSENEIKNLMNDILFSIEVNLNKKKNYLKKDGY